MEVTINTKSIDNIMDLGNFIKNFFGAKVQFFEKNDNGVALAAYFPTDRFIKIPPKREFIFVVIFVGGNSKIYQAGSGIDAFFLELCLPNIENKPYFEFENMEDLVNYLKSELTQITFPDMEVRSVRPIDFEDRKKRIDQWKSIFQQLIPYGLIVRCVEDYPEIADYGRIFELEWPNKPTPKEVSEKQKYDSDYYSGDGYIGLEPGEDWVKIYKEIVVKLETIYNIPNIPN